MTNPKSRKRYSWEAGGTKMSKFQKDVEKNMKDPQYKEGWDEAGRLVEIQRWMESQPYETTRSSCYTFRDAAEELLKICLP